MDNYLKFSFNSTDYKLGDLNNNLALSEVDSQIPESSPLAKCFDLVTEFELGDFPLRFPTAMLAEHLKSIWKLAKHDAVCKIRIPHPRHDTIFSDIRYVRPMMPKSLVDFANSLGLNFELQDVQYELDSNWEKSLEEKKVTEQEIEQLAFQANNVIEWLVFDLRVNKSTWKNTQTPLVSPEMRKQMMEQIEMHLSKGNHEAANTIRAFLAKQGPLTDSFIPQESNQL